MFQQQLKQLDANKILESIAAQEEEKFNESVLRVLCLNQAIEKHQS